jgi:hypothetical protein
VLAQNFIPGLFSLRIANKRPPGSSPQFAQSFDNGWLTFGDIYSYLLNFHHQPDYEVEAAQYAYSVTQPVSVTEFFSASGLTVPSPGFKGKVMVTTGKYDTALCDGECDRIYALKIADHIFPAAAQVLPYVHPNAGHGLNFEKNAPEYYTELLKFLASL